MSLGVEAFSFGLVRFPAIHMAQLNLIVYQVWSMYQTDKVKDNLKILRYLAKFARAAFKAWFIIGCGQQ